MSKSTVTDVELFAGGGGMAVGLSSVGFRPAILYEIDHHSCETLRANIISNDPTLSGNVVEGDAAAVDWNSLAKPVRVLAAGAPCQPFSLAGKHRADKDGRNLFPQVLRATRTLRPKAVFLENVRGLARQSFRDYYEYIIRQLGSPSLNPRPDETWRDHDARIRNHQQSPRYEPEYHVSTRLVDAADYGVPQRRHRVFIVATRADIPLYEFPRSTHSQSALLHAQATGAYWERHRIAGHKGRETHHDPRGPQELPWLTVRDAMLNLPPPAPDQMSAQMNHWHIPGARTYAGHSGSVMDLPAKTIKAGVHGVPGGENTITDAVGNFRYFTLRETARLQTFPDSHIFVGARIHITRQIGNAVPCTLAAALSAPLWHITSDTRGIRTQGA